MKVSVIDAMAEVQSLDKPEQIRNCSHLADHFVSRIFEKNGDSDEIRLIFDRYDIPASLKQATRLKRDKDSRTLSITESPHLRSSLKSL